MPPFNFDDGYEGIVDVPGKDMKDVLINFPLYSDVSELYVGLSESAKVEAPAPYSLEKPVVYYGSSVTQGGCASRAGTSYQGFISRELDIDYINLGFSGSAKAEKEMYEYISKLDMSVFVMDYDYNTTSAEELQATHERMFLAIREAQPELPIVILTLPKYTLPEWARVRRDIIRSTYERALARGDKNVYFIDGPTLMALCGDEGTVDTTHPTDFGFYSMASAVSKVLREILGK